MSDLSAAAAALGVPEAIVQRSAAARAAETGMTVDEVLAAWAGGGSVEAPSGAATQPAPETTETAAEETAEVETVPEEVPAAAAPAARAAAAPSGPVARVPVPAEVTPAQAAALPEVITVPTAGIRERMNLAIPGWLAGVILIIPAFALIALGGSATGECGAATELQTDVVTGDIVNCDGTEFTGSGAGGGSTDFLAQGEAIYNAAPGNCQGCHGATGGGSGTIPALTGVLSTFSACPDHLAWVQLGSQGFRDAGESTYGDPNKPIAGGMPAFGTSLSAEQLASVVAFERVRFGGADPATVLTDCGLAPAEGEGGEGGEPGEGGTSVPPGEGGTSVPPGEGEAPATTTPSGAEARAGGTG